MTTELATPQALHARHRATREAWLNDFNTLPPDHLWRSDVAGLGDAAEEEDDTFQGVPTLSDADLAQAEAEEMAEAEMRLRRLRIERGDYPSLEDLQGLSAERGREVTREEALRWAGMQAGEGYSGDADEGDDESEGEDDDDEGPGHGTTEPLDEDEMLSEETVKLALG
jgi:hypothetical protein